MKRKWPKRQRGWQPQQTYKSQSNKGEIIWSTMRRSRIIIIILLFGRTREHIRTYILRRSIENALDWLRIRFQVLSALLALVFSFRSSFVFYIVAVVVRCVSNVMAFFFFSCTMNLWLVDIHLSEPSIDENAQWSHWSQWETHTHVHTYTFIAFRLLQLLAPTLKLKRKKSPIE